MIVQSNLCSCVRIFSHYKARGKERWMSTTKINGLVLSVLDKKWLCLINKCFIYNVQPKWIKRVIRYPFTIEYPLLPLRSPFVGTTCIRQMSTTRQTLYLIYKVSGSVSVLNGLTGKPGSRMSARMRISWNECCDVESQPRGSENTT